MNILNRAIWINQLIAGLFIASGFAILEAWFAVPIILFWMIPSIIGWKANWKWVPSFFLLSGCFLVGYVCFEGVNILWMLVAVSALLVTWDLQCLKIKFDQFPRIENGRLIIIVHLRRLGYIIGTSFLLAIVSQMIKFNVAFGLTLLLGLIVFTGLNLVFGKLRTAGR